MVLLAGRNLHKALGIFKKPSMVINNKFNIGDTVFLKTDPDQLPRLVISIEATANEISYQLMCGATNSYHFAFEISPQKSYHLLN